MISLEQARQSIAETRSLPSVSLPLHQAIGAVLAEPIVALQDVPHCATSAMDGWAIAEHGEPSEPGRGHVEAPAPRWMLRSESAESPVRQPAPLHPGEAAEVVTGSPVPTGTLSVLRSEHGIVSQGQLEALASSGDTTPLRNIRSVGTEAQAGDQLISAGAVLSPAGAATAAVAGYDCVTVVPQPRVQLVLTGEEIVTHGVPSGGHVRDVFGLALPGMVTFMGAVPVDSRRLGDDVEALVAALEQIARSGSADLIITSGGTSHSKADSLRPALARIGAEVILDAVDMRPGHPTLIARLPGTEGAVHLLGLPGNPLAGFAGLAALGAPLLDALRGVPATQRGRTLKVTAGSALEGASRGTRLLPVRMSRQGAVPAGYSNSHMMRGLANSDALAIVPSGGVAQGQTVQCLEVPGQGQGGLRWDA